MRFGHKGGAALVPGQDQFDIVGIVQTVQRRQIAFAWNAKYGVDAV